MDGCVVPSAVDKDDVLNFSGNAIEKAGYIVAFVEGDETVPQDRSIRYFELNALCSEEAGGALRGVVAFRRIP